ncbi:hypothetical protein V2K22_20730 [Pseudomonas alliivorans]|nr:hypothetical protein [Pseudomonas alliivorans]
MRTLSQPPYDPADVFQDCIRGISKASLRAKFKLIEAAHVAQASDYSKKARSAKLYRYPEFDGGKSDAVVGGITKNDFYKLYVQYFAGDKKPARTYYDALFMSSPNQKCPYCAIGDVYTLDHYLPKSKFPQFSTLVTNLVPACRDCNEGSKRTSSASSFGDQTLHPYFDKGGYYNAQWLFANIIESSPPVVEFYVSCPLSWSMDEQKRVQAHFEGFRLKTRYGIRAAGELTSVNTRLIMHYSNASMAKIRANINETYTAEQSLNANSWMTAMYMALVRSDWYCGGGFKC